MSRTDIDGPTVLPANDGYIGELDGFRAIAVGFVVAAHYRLLPYVPGAFGVTLFFFLSGYLITTLFFAEQYKTSRISIPKFYLRRWLRLTPSLLVCILLSVVFHGMTRNFVGGGPVPLATTAAALLYYTNYFDLICGMDDWWVIPFGVFWSLAIEEHFYLIWPWIVRNMVTVPERLCVLVLFLCLVITLWRFVAHYSLGFSEQYTYMATDCRIDSILYGASLRIMLETRWAARIYKILCSRVSLAAGLIGLFLMFVVRDEGFRQTARYSIQGICLMPVFLMVLNAKRDGVIRKILASKPMVLVGQMSYAIYLFHLPARTPGEVYFHSPYSIPSILIGLSLTILISWSLLMFVDRPVARMRHRFRPSN